MGILTRIELEGLFALAGIKMLRVWQMPNQYITPSPTESDEDILREAIYRHRRPWWLVKTTAGCVLIGPRKRVIEIDWSDTPIRKKLFEEQYVTSYEHFCHAWSTEKALEYLKLLAREINALEAQASGVHCTAHVDYDPESRQS